MVVSQHADHCSAHVAAVRRDKARIQGPCCAEGGLDAWFDEVRKARWSSAADVRRSYATASIVSADRVVFNIKGNDYRLIVAVDFEKSIVWIKWIGTHRDYDKIDVKEVRYDGD
jgi:mRNA interferase HigB